MVNVVIKESRDLNTHPKAILPGSEAITIGDLHGNALKFVHFLITHNVIKFKDSVADPVKAYEDFALFYEESRARAAPCLKTMSDISFYQKNIHQLGINLEKNTVAIEDKLTTILPDGLQSVEILQGLLDSSSEDESEAFQAVGTNETLKTIIRSHIVEKGKRLGEGLAELLPQVEATFPDIFLEFKDLIEQRNKFIGYREQSIKDNKPLEIKLEEESKALQELVPIFNQFMDTLEISDRRTLVRLIGDELADRGSNDYFTLRLLDFLHENGVQVHINISNHSNEFIGAYESKTFNSPGEVIDKQKPSFLALKLLVDRGLVSKGEVDALIQRSYKPSLKVIDYELSDKGITLFTHAPVNFTVIKLIADKLKVEYSDSTKEALGATIDGINSKFAEAVAANKVHQLCTGSSDKFESDAEIIESPLFYLIWNRWKAGKDTETARPATVNGYSCTYVHGHDNYISRFENIINLDTSCGKEDRKTQDRYIAEAKADIERDPDSPLTLEARNYLDSLQETVLVSNGIAPKPRESFAQRFETLQAAASDPADDPELQGPDF